MQPVDGAHAALGRDRPARSSPRRPRRSPSGVATVSSARTTVVPTAMTRPPAGAVGVDARGGERGDAVALGVGPLAELERARRRCGARAARPGRRARSRSSSTRWENGRPALGISALPGSSAKIVCRSSSGRGSARWRVGDRAAVRGEVVVQRQRAGRARRSTGGRARGTWRAAQRSRRPAARGAGRRSRRGSGAPLRRSSTTHRPLRRPPRATGVERCSVERRPRTAPRACVARRVDDEQVARPQVVGQAAEHVVHQRAAALRDEQANLVALGGRGGSPRSRA